MFKPFFKKIFKSLFNPFKNGLKTTTISCILSNGQIWSFQFPSVTTIDIIIKIKIDFVSNKLLEMLDMPKQYLHLEQFKKRYGEFYLGVYLACVTFSHYSLTVQLEVWTESEAESTSTKHFSTLLKILSQLILLFVKHKVYNTINLLVSLRDSLIIKFCKFFWTPISEYLNFNINLKRGYIIY
jgi:hypothetical protein